LFSFAFPLLPRRTALTIKHDVQQPIHTNEFLHSCCCVMSNMLANSSDKPA